MDRYLAKAPVAMEAVLVAMLDGPMDFFPLIKHAGKKPHGKRSNHQVKPRHWLERQ
jgi:hypothetical protein